MSIIVPDKKYKAKLNRIRKLVGELYAESKQRIQPLYPWVFVKVLPREQSIGGTIILPESQNKIMLEALVLATWRPFVKTHVGTTAYAEDVPYCTTVVSELRVGDHIIFPYSEGMPAGDLFDEKEFRFVRESNAGDDTGWCQVLGRLDYERQEEQVFREALLNSAKNGREHKTFENNWLRVYSALSNAYYLVPKTTASKTVSGR